jgi:alkaline phosphatase D
MLAANLKRLLKLYMPTGLKSGLKITRCAQNASAAAARRPGVLRPLLKHLHPCALSIALLTACTNSDQIADPLDPATTLNRIAFGSCNKQDKPQPLWDAVIASAPQLWIWAGDNIYADTDNMATMQRQYRRQKDHPGYHRLRAFCPIIGTWDDHDYGSNDGGKEFQAKKDSQRLLLDFLDEPATSPRRHQAGIYTSYSYGPPAQQIKIILLDTRYHRDKPGPTADVLGEAQWHWLETQLQNSPAQLHLIVSSIQVLSQQHPWEKWANFPQSRQRLLDLLVKHHVPGVLFISGDRHFGELSVLTVPDLPYPLHDITASGLTHSYRGTVKESNDLRRGPVVNALHFGVLEIDWNMTPPHLEMQWRNKDNKPWQTQAILLEPL